MKIDRKLIGPEGLVIGKVGKFTLVLHQYGDTFSINEDNSGTLECGQRSIDYIKDLDRLLKLYHQWCTYHD